MSQNATVDPVVESPDQTTQAPDVLRDPLLQLQPDHLARSGSSDPLGTAAGGVAGGGAKVPYFDTLQQSFGHHDLSGVSAHSGPAASEAAGELGANAYAFGNDIAFAGSPTLHTAAHEAAHVVQQREGVSLLGGGVGKAGDVYEQHADSVADVVVQGGSAESLLDATPGGIGSGVQLEDGPQQKKRAMAERVDTAKATQQRRDDLALEGVQDQWLLGPREAQDEVLDDKGKKKKDAVTAAPGEGDVGSVVEGTPTSLPLLAASTMDTVSKFPLGGGPQARPILKKALGENWFFAIKVLVNGEWPSSLKPTDYRDTALINDKASSQEMMKRLLGLRDWETYEILNRMQKDYMSLPEAEGMSADDVLKVGAPGSNTLTSDIDVNMKGLFNHRAVLRFNMEFKKRGWSHQAGTVYDVNVYCKDNMHGLGTKNVETDEGTTKKVMTIKQEDNVPEGAKFDANAKDVKNQEIATLIKMLRFMCHGHAHDGEHGSRWEAYKAGVGCGKGVALNERPEEVDDKLSLAETRYEKWRAALKAERDRLLKSGKVAANTLTDIADEEDAEKEHEAALDMQASNELYARKALEVEKLRKELQALGSEDPNSEKLAVALRQAVLEAGMFANEAMISRGASNFVVFGTQEGVKMGVDAIELTEAQFYHAFNEQLADTVKEFGHYAGDLGKGLLKGGKYLMRMTLAVDQLPGTRAADMDALRKLGTLSTQAKAMEDVDPGKRQTALAQLLATAGLSKEIGPTESDKFIDEIVIPFGIEVSNAYEEYKTQNSDHDTGQLKQGSIRPSEEARASADAQLLEKIT